MKQILFDKLDKAYDILTNEEDARICKDISEESCQYTGGNFFILLSSNSLSKLGDVLANPKTVLTWLMQYVQAPLFLISFIVPIREAFSMLPQIVIAHYIRQLPMRKWIWVLGSALQFFSMAGMGLFALYLTGLHAGIWMIIMLTIFSLSRGLCSVASKDVLGKTIPKTRRGRLNGYAGSISGIMVVVSAFILLLNPHPEQDIRYYTTLIFAAALLWLLAALVYSGINEFAGETTGGRNGLKEAFLKIRIVQTDRAFRQFLLTRSLLLCSALSAPFYIVLAQQHLGAKSILLGLFILANGLASALSAPYWGKQADRSSKKVLIKAALLASLLGILVYGITLWAPGIQGKIWFYPLIYFVLSIAHDGIRLGRKTYIVDLASGDKRTEYVAVGNTLIGLILLITGGLSALLSLFSAAGVILGLSLMGLLGAYSSSKLKEIE